MLAAAPAALWQAMGWTRNAGRPGVGAMAVSAVDVALWDLKARLLDLPLVHLLPAYHERVPVYGSGGFTNYPLDRLTDQLGGWARQGIPRVKLKTSREPGRDPARLTAVRRALGDEVEILTDANGALGRKEALYWAGRFHEEWDVRWFEEPVSSADLEGLRLLRERGPARLEIAAGEYAYTARDFVNLVHAGAVDCLQADVTRCGGITGLLEIAGLSAAEHLDLSAHCAPAVSAHAFCAVRRARHLEYFHDHVRVEGLLLDGTLSPAGVPCGPTPAARDWASTSSGPTRSPTACTGRARSDPAGLGGTAPCPSPRVAPWIASRCGASASRSRKTLPESGNARPFSGSA